MNFTHSPQIFFICFFLIFSGNLLIAQKYFTREGSITLISETPVERIEAFNKTATSVIDFSSGAMDFAALIKAFHFEKAILQDYFNENFLQSNEYPKAVFKGKILNYEDIDLTKAGVHQVAVEGELTAHGQTKKVRTNGSLKINGDIVNAIASFTLSADDYKIPIPEVVKENLAKEIKIDINVKLKPFGK